jgi:hypothetical protein
VSVATPGDLRRWANLGVRFSLAAFLLLAAALKVGDVVRDPRGWAALPVATWLPHSVALLVEIGLCAALLFRATVERAAAIAGAAFAGVGFASLVHVLTGTPEVACRCLGAWRIGTGTALLVHGLIVIASATILGTLPAQTLPSTRPVLSP